MKFHHAAMLVAGAPIKLANASGHNYNQQHQEQKGKKFPCHALRVICLDGYSLDRYRDESRDPGDPAQDGEGRSETPIRSILRHSLDNAEVVSLNIASSRPSFKVRPKSQEVPVLGRHAPLNVWPINCLACPCRES